MNTPTTPTPDLESLRKAVQQFRPDPHRIPFNGLKPVHNFITQLRKQNASYAVIAELLQQHGVRTSRARVAEYGRIVLEGGKSRKRRKRAKPMPVVNAPVAPQSAPAADATPAPTTTPAAATSKVPPPAKENSNSPYTSSGPRIANVPMMSPEEVAELEVSFRGLKSPAFRGFKIPHP